MSLRTVNLNLVPILRSLLRTRSVSQAADQLGLSQGAASNALSRLRATFDDPLLVRVGAHMELTARAVDLIGPTEELCAGLDNLFSHPLFDPATVERTFVIATSDYSTLLIAGPVLAAIERTAPKASLRFVDIVDRLSERMGEREVDIAIVPEAYLEFMAPDRFNSIRLVTDEPVAVFWREHPLAALSTVGVDDLAAYKLIAFHPSSERIERRNPNAFMGGHRFDIAAFVPQVTGASFLLPETEYFSIEPSGVARRMMQLLPLEMRPLAFPVQPLHIALAWGPVNDSDPAHRWLRSVVHDAIVRLAL